MDKVLNKSERSCLQKGAKLRLWQEIDGQKISRIFEIEEKMDAEGASSVCYKARHDGAGGVLKEFYPLKSSLKRESDKNSPWYLQLRSSDNGTDVSFQEEKERYIHAHQRHINYRRDKNTSELSVFIPYFEIYEGCEGNKEGTVYIWMPHPKYSTFEEICADIRNNPEENANEKLLLITESIESLLLCLDVLDNNEIFHGDIKPDNFGFDTLGGIVQTQRLYLFDINSFCSVGEEPQVLGSPGFYDRKTRPNKYNGFLRDIYSVGAVIYYAVVINEETRSCGCIYTDDPDSYSSIENSVRNSELIRALPPDISEPAAGSITMILHSCLAGASNRYKSYEAILTDITNLQRLIRSCEQPYELIESLPKPRSGFMGRANELKRIEELLEKGDLAFLRGEGGIGKSELAINAAVRYKEKHTKARVVFAVYKENIKQTICSQIILKGLSDHTREDPDEYYHRKLKALKETADKDTLFIIDNFDVDDDPELKELLKGNYKVLFTTRNYHRAYFDKELEVGVLGDTNALISVFKNYYESSCTGKKLKEEDIPYVRKLIDRFDRHTYMTELLAKQLAAGHQSAKALWQLYEEKGLDQPQKETIEGYKGMLTPYDHICEVFSVSRLSEDEEMILRKISILDIHKIEPEQFKNWAGLSDFETVNKLVLKGWIREKTDMETNETYFSLHPLVKEVVSSKLKPDAKNCADLLRRIGEWVFPAWGRADMENQKAAGHILALAKHFAPFDEKHTGAALDKEHVVLWCMFPSFLWQVNQFESSENYAKIMLKTCENAHGISIHTSYCAAQLANCYHNSGRDREALALFEKALEHIEAGYADSDEAAWCYARLAMCYTMEYRQDLKKALYYALKARNIRLKLLDQLGRGQHVWCYEEDWRPYGTDDTRRGIAAAYKEAARVYIAAGKYRDALRCADKSVEMMEKIPEGRMFNVSREDYYFRKGTCLYHIGSEKKKLGDKSYTDELGQAYKVLKKCIDIQEPGLGSASDTVLSTKEYLADTCAASDLFDEAIKYYGEVILSLKKYYANDPERLEVIKNKMNRCTENK